MSPKELRQQMRAVVKEATAILEQLHDLDPSVNTIQHLASLQDGEALQNCATLLIDYAVRCPDLDLDESETPRTMASIINLVVSLAVDANKK